MAPDPKCSALAGALSKSGMTRGQLASKVNSTEQRVNEILAGDDKPTDAEFRALASALGIADVPHTGAHATK